MTATILHPRLIQKRGEERREMIGYLQRFEGGVAMCIGRIDSVEFKLVQSLFSPFNGHKTGFLPLQQATERTYKNTFSRLDADDSSPQMLNEMDAAVSKVVEKVRETVAGEYLTFVQHSGYIRMSIT
ncbi:MAG: hypothetical protein ACM3TU_01825 [Bacillota bacterium]